jgi:WD40 repeat protein
MSARVAPWLSMVAVAIVLMGGAASGGLPGPSSAYSIEVLGNARMALTSQDARYLAIVDSSQIRVHDGASLAREVTITLAERHEWFGLLSFSADGRFLAAPVGNSRVEVWDLTTGAELRSFDVKARPYTLSYFAPMGTTLAVVAGRNVELWDAEMGEQELVLEGHRKFVTSAAFSPDGTRLASSDDDVIILWDVASGAELSRVTHQGDPIYSMTFDAHGGRLVGAGEAGVIHVWDVASGEELLAIVAHEEAVIWIALNGDRTVVATGSRDATVGLWSLDTGEQIATLDLWALLGPVDNATPPSLPPDAFTRVSGVAFGPSDTYLAITYNGAIEGIIALWNLEEIL